MRYVLSVMALTLIYAFTLASFHPWDLAIGAVLASALIGVHHAAVFNHGPGETGQNGPPLVERIVRFVPFALAVIWDITVGTWTMILIVLGIRPLFSPGIVQVPIGDRTPAGVAVSGIATTLSPGTVLVDVDWENRVMLIHAIDARDPDKVRQAHQEFYDRYQRYVFP